jgi:3-deoxy-D-manno-octulosonic-acid transferase
LIFIYTAAFTLLVPLLLVRLFVRGIRDPDSRKRWRERFGHGLPDFRSRGRPVWIHAVSVGEAIAAGPVIGYLLEHHADIPVLVTTTTATGAATVRTQFGSSIEHRYFPYDLPWVARRFLRQLEPRMLILMETELWPHLLRNCAAMNIPVIVANARLSARSAARYARFSSALKPMLQAIECIAVQGRDDGERFIALGAKRDAVVVTGSLKFDIELPPSVVESGQAIRRFLGVNRAVLMAGSTREGEEPLLLQAYTRLLETRPDLLLLIAPRHPERFEAVAELCQRVGFSVARHSLADPCTQNVQVYLIDTMGELPGFYAAADVAFVGGSLVARGGHNVLEPAALGVPVVVGMYTYNFSEIVRMLGAAGALVQVDDVDGLVGAIERWIADGEVRDEAGAAGRAIVLGNRGAAKRLVAAIDAALDPDADIAA